MDAGPHAAAAGVARALVAAGGAVYATTALLGVGLATGIWRNRRHRWVHHVGYITAVTLTAAGAATGLRADRTRAALATAALVPLTVLPRVPTRSRFHPALALTAAPWLIAAIVRRPR